MEKKIFKIKYVTNIGLGYWIDRFDGEFGTIGHYNVLLLPFCIIRWGTVTKIEPKPIWKQIIETCGGEEPFIESAGLKPKEETIEEVAKNSDKSKCKHFRREHTKIEVYDSFEEGFIEGANWHAKRSYSEEDMMKAVRFGEQYKSESSKSLFEKRGTTPTEVLKTFFEQFKKK
jgi:hypothetical protein